MPATTTDDGCRRGNRPAVGVRRGGDGVRLAGLAAAAVALLLRAPFVVVVVVAALVAALLRLAGLP